MKRRVNHTLLFVLLTFCGCDLNVPEKWEVPQWTLPLTMPLIDQIMGFEGLLQGDVLTVDTTTSQIQIELTPNETEKMWCSILQSSCITTCRLIMLLGLVRHVVNELCYPNAIHT